MRFFPEQVTLPLKESARCFVCGRLTTYRVLPRGPLLRIVCIAFFHPRGLPLCVAHLRRFTRGGKP